MRRQVTELQIGNARLRAVSLASTFLNGLARVSVVAAIGLPVGPALVGGARADGPAPLVIGECQGSGSACVTLTAPVPGRISLGESLEYVNGTVLRLNSTNEGIETIVQDASLAAVVTGSLNGAGRTTFDNLLSTATGLGLTVSASEATAVNAVLAGRADQAGTFGRADVWGALGAIEEVSERIMPTSGNRAQIHSVLASADDAMLRPLLSAEFAGVAITDGTASEVDARLAAGRVLFRSLSVATILQRFPDNQGFYDTIASVKDANGVVYLPDLLAAMAGIGFTPTNEQLAELRRLLAGREQGTDRYNGDDIFIAAEASGEAGEAVGNARLPDGTIQLAALVTSPVIPDMRNGLAAGLAALETDQAGLVDADALRIAASRALIDHFAPRPMTGASLNASESGGGTPDARGIYVSNAYGDTDLTSRVAINVEGSSASGIMVQTLTGDTRIVNEGEVTVSGAFSAGIRVWSGTGDVLIENRSSVSATGKEAEGISAIITADSDADIAILNTGDLTVAEAGTDSLHVGGIRASAQSGDVSVVNEGSVTVTGRSGVAIDCWSRSGAVEVENAGTLSATGASAAGIRAEAEGATATIVNTGRIEATGQWARGIEVSSGLTLVVNGGTIHAVGQNAIAVDVSSSSDLIADDVNLAVRNAGTFASDGVDSKALTVSSGAGQIVNEVSGRITASGDGAIGLAAMVGEAAGGTLGLIEIVNNGVILGGSGGGVPSFDAPGQESLGPGIGLVTGAAGSDADVTATHLISLTNTGTIGSDSGYAVVTFEALASGIVDSDGDAVTFAPVAHTIENAGTLDGAVLLGSAVDVVRNTGRINGAVSLGGGDDLFATVAGASQGALDGGAGVDTLMIGGIAGSHGILAGDSVSNFERGRKVGAGDWTITGMMTGTTLAVEQGRVRIEGGIGAVMLAGGTSLYGGGTVGGLTATGAQLRPGDSFTTAAVGQLSVAGDLVLNSASSVMLDVTATGADRIAVSGRATLGGATLMARGADVVGGRSFDIVTAEGGVEGRFAPTVSWTDSVWAFLGLETEYLADRVRLTVVDPVSSSKSGMAKSERTFLDTVFGATPRLDTEVKAEAYEQLGNAIAAVRGDRQQINGVVREMRGAGINAGARASAEAVRSVGQAVSRATDAALGVTTAQSSGVSLAYLDEPQPSGGQYAIAQAAGTKPKVTTIDPLARRIAVWMTGQFGFGNIESGATSVDYTTGGLAGGVIYRLDEAWSVGVSGAYTNTGVDVANPGSKLGINSWHVGVNAVYDTRNFRLDGLVGYAFQDFRNKRPVLGLTALGEYDGSAVRASFEGALKYTVANATVMPFAGIDMMFSRTSGYTETGAGAANLTVGAASDTSVDTRIGVRVSSDFALNETTTITPDLSLAWVHSWGDLTSTMNASLAGAAFSTTGAARPADALAVSAGLTVKAGEAFSAFGRYSGRFAEGYDSHDFSGGVRYQW